ncbi:D-glucuronyl C5-epimerase family protein [Micromonospora sp. WMMD882]|uniref:D-glucuronyl C5-epimerase family protein n=1 Tax=Micromonospora sp. WMMD882 TaxID=3015151 RepID=UPI00248AACFB|nr:D-glucuronyl C5-epimerase family protein [Micromonospora sp. WMMD882]WBB78236.1 D-glucuronyl C5-epimerase family protein [Micromonospora sp. WMMD882]
MTSPSPSSRSRWSRRSVLAAATAAGAAPLLTEPATAAPRSPGTTPALPARPAAPKVPAGAAAPNVVDPAYELGAPSTARELGDVARLSPSQGRQLRSSPEDAGPSTTAADAEVPFTFRYDPFEIRELPASIKPYHMSEPVSLTDSGTHDEHGVRMALLGGVLYDHPVNQAQYGIQLLESFRLTRSAAYLQRAIKQAQRLVDRRVEHQGGWFYPYPFRHALHRSADIYEPPWYSMMAQGQVLSLFVRLAQAVGSDSFWAQAADATFASFLVPAVAGKPWGVYVKEGLLWLEEYAHHAQIRGDLTYNGHIFSAYGLWDYWTLTRDERAALLLRGAITTARDVHLDIRTRQWRSKYCLTHGNDSGNYHTTHLVQHTVLHAITGDSTFAGIADLYYSDHPPRGVSGTVMFAAGDHVGHQFDENGTVTATKQLNLTKASNAPSGERLKVMRQTGIWYAITAGAFNGYLVRETPGQVYQIGACAQLGYRIPRPATVAVAPVKAYTIDADGRMTSVTTDLRVGQSVTVDVRAVLNGVQHVRLASGDHTGRWVGINDLTLR